MRLVPALFAMALLSCEQSRSSAAPTKLYVDERPKRIAKLTARDGSRTLVYDCDHFERQAKTGADIKLVVENLGPMLREMSRAKDLVALQSVSSAHDLARREQLLVEWRCGHALPPDPLAPDLFAPEAAEEP